MKFLFVWTFSPFHLHSYSLILKEPMTPESGGAGRFLTRLLQFGQMGSSAIHMALNFAEHPPSLGGFTDPLGNHLGSWQ